jgi:hypothetical protein
MDVPRFDWSDSQQPHADAVPFGRIGLARVLDNTAETTLRNGCRRKLLHGALDMPG